MRILHVIPTIALEHGGPSYAVRRFAKALRDLGHEVDIATTSFGMPQGKEDPKRTWIYEEDGVGYYLFPRTGPWRYTFSAKLTQWLFANARSYDIFHAHAPFSYAPTPACLAARYFGIPYIYRTLGTLDPWCLKQGAWKKRPYYWLIERRNLQGAKFIHVTAESERQALAALGFADQVAVVPLGVDAGAPILRTAKEGPLRLLFLSRIHPKKGIPILLEAMNQVLRQHPQGIRLILAGAGEPAHERETRECVRAMGLEGKVEFRGFVDGAEKRQVLEDADVFVLPAYDENFGVAVVEAMAAGLPVLVSDQVGVASWVREAGAGLISETGNASSLAETIRCMMQRTERERMGKAARALVDAKFTIPAMGRNVLEMYRKALPGGAWGGPTGARPRDVGSEAVAAVP